MSSSVAHRVQSPPVPSPQQGALFLIGPRPVDPRSPAAALERLRRNQTLRANAVTSALPKRPSNQSPLTRQVTSTAWARATVQASRQRECQRRPELFALSDTDIDLVDGITTPADLPPIPAGRRPSVVNLWPATFDDLDAERRAVAARVRQVKPAVNACKGCAFLRQCQDETLDDIACGRRPENVVVAGVAWTADGVPDPHVHEHFSRREASQLTLDDIADFTVYRDNPEVSWLPADLEPIPALDEMTIAAVLDRTNIDASREKTWESKFVSQHYLDCNPGTTAEMKTIISRAEEWEIVRRACESGLTTYNIATVLSTSWARAADMSYVLGFDIPAHKPSTTAVERRIAREEDVHRRETRLQRLREAQQQTLALTRAIRPAHTAFPQSTSQRSPAYGPSSMVRRSSSASAGLPA
jgi:hypothetical protein